MVNQPKLSQLRDCFQGIIPALFCTHDEASEPNISFLSQVEYLDENHLALSNQFFSKTKQNILKTKNGLLLILHPASLQTFEIRVRYLKSEVSGDVFEKLQLRLQIIAASEGMSHVFQLRSADIYEVTEIVCRNSITRKPVNLPAPKDERLELSPSELSKSFLESVSSKKSSTEECIALLLRSIRYGFGFPETKFYWVNENSAQSIEAEMMDADGEFLGADRLGIIRKVFQFGKPLIVSGLQLQRKYANSISLQPSKAQSNISRRIALPILYHGKTQAVLLVEDEKSEAWDLDLVSSLKMMANTLGLVLSRDSDSVPFLKKKSIRELKFRLHRSSETLFFEDAALFKSLPAKIFAYIIEKAKEKSAISNQEIICALENDFPKEGKTNLEARLSLIKKRIQERAIPLKIVAIERGRFQLVLDEGFQISFSKE
jgi:adenylate cyclase